MIKKSIINVLKTKWFLILILAFDIALVAVLTSLPAFVLASLVDTLNGATSFDNVSKDLLFVSLSYFVVMIGQGLAIFLEQNMLVTIGENFTYNVRNQLSNKLDTINSQVLNDLEIGEVSSVFINDVDSISTLFGDGLISLVIDCFKIISIVISMFIFSWILGVTSLVVIPIVFIITDLVKKKMFKAQLENRETVGVESNLINETINNRLIIKMNSLERYLYKTYGTILDKEYKSIEKINIYDSVFSPIMKTFLAILIALLIGLTGYNPLIIGITVGGISGGIQLLENLFAPIENIGMELQTIQKSLSGIRRVNDFLKLPDDDKKLNITLKDVVGSNHLQFEVKDLSFGYDKESILFTNVNFLVKEKEKVSIIGRTGIGKTTLIKLFLGQLKPTYGQVTLNGYPTYLIPNEIKGNLFGLVSQSFDSIEGTIKDNITLGREFEDEAVLAALKKVGLDKKTQELTLGINEPYEPSLFSEGEKSLLSIARSIIADPYILVLDEMSSKMDYETEKKILNFIEQFAQNKTIISISHRKSSLIHSDKIILIDKSGVEIKDLL